MRATLETIENGAPGLRRKLERMRELVGAAVRDPHFRSRTAAVIHQVPEKDHDGEIRAIVDHVRGGIRYMRDPYDPDGLELFIDPKLMLADVDAGTAAGDCDDHVLLAAAMLGVAGYPTKFVVGGMPPDDYRHIWVDVMHPRRGWVPVELTSKRMPIGADPSDRFPLVERHKGYGVGTLGDDSTPSGWHNLGELPSDRYRRRDVQGRQRHRMLPSDANRRADFEGRTRPVQLPGHTAGSWIPRPSDSEFPNAPAVTPFGRPTGSGGGQINPRFGEPIMIANTRHSMPSGTLGALPSFQSLMTEFQQFLPIAQQFAPVVGQLIPGLQPLLQPFLPPPAAPPPPPLPLPPLPQLPPRALPPPKTNPVPMPPTPQRGPTVVIQAGTPAGAPAPSFLGGISPMMLGLGGLALLLLLDGGRGK